MSDLTTTKRKHRPSHFYSADYLYFITSGTYQKKKLFNTQVKKENLVKILNEMLDLHHFKPHAFVILDNHYHLVTEISDENLLQDFIRKLHSKTAVWLNKHDGVQGRKVWYQYWDRCIRDEEEYFNDLNYIYWNPVKHGYIKDVKEYPFMRIECKLLEYGDYSGELNMDFDDF